MPQICISKQNRWLFSQPSGLRGILNNGRCSRNGSWGDCYTMVQRVNGSSGSGILSRGYDHSSSDRLCQRGTPIAFGNGNPGCASGECCAKGSTHAEARKCINSTDCLGCGTCTFCFESHTFAGNWCDKPPVLYRCDGGTCATAPRGAAGVDLDTCQRVCLKDGYACQDRQCVPQAGGVNKSTCARICDPNSRNN